MMGPVMRMETVGVKFPSSGTQIIQSVNWTAL